MQKIVNMFMDKKIIDVCCGSRMFYFDKNNKNVLFQELIISKGVPQMRYSLLEIYKLRD